jgi:CubicO group peptidase (beta-lactamase class C family)
MKTPTLLDALGPLDTDSTRALAARLEFAPPISVAAVVRTSALFSTFVDTLVKTCSGQDLGFGWAVFYRDHPVPFASGGDGLAVRATGKVPDVQFTAQTRLNVHSISKTICAAAVVRALHLNDAVTLDSPIGPFLRSDWDVAAGVGNVTFAQLLLHDSGLIDLTGPIDERSYAGVKWSVEHGLVQLPGLRDYQNVNFSLCRMLLPFIDGARDPHALNAMPETDFDTWTTDHFIATVRRHLFPADLPAEIVPEPNGPTPFTRYYDVDDGTVCDIEPLPQTNRAHVGASSWWMSAIEYGRFISRLRFALDYGAPGEAWSPWAAMSDPARSITPSALKSATYRLGMTEEEVGDAHPALAKSGGGGGGRPTTAWLGVRDLTATLCVNATGGDLFAEDDLAALKVLDKAARKAIAAAGPG